MTEDMVWRSAAVERVRSLRRAVLEERGTEAARLSEIAGRTLAEDVVADRDHPPRSHATMDGFAFDATDEYPLTVIDAEVYPEDEPPALEAGEAIRIATGATLPPGANAVLKREEATVADDGGTDESLTGASIQPGTYVYERGSNVAAGDTLFEAGEQLAPRDAILLADLGRETVQVRRRPTVGLLATGTEIHEGKLTDLDSPMLANLVRAWGAEPTYEGTVPDDYERVRSRIDDLAATYDVVMTTGGTSVGRKDYAVRALADLGDVRFHRVRVRPGKPIAVARLADHDAVAFAIPGKPVGAHTIATLVARPFFTAEDTLPTVEATMTRDVGIGPDGFEYVIPVTLDGDEAMPMGHPDSPVSVYRDTFDPSVLSSTTRATRADAFVITEAALAAGESVRAVPYTAVA